MLIRKVELLTYLLTYLLTHSTVGFLQHKTITKKQSIDPVFQQQLDFFKNHHWTLSKTAICELCKSTKIAAGIHCNDCKLDMCRPCSRRMHAAKEMQVHKLHEI